jgi:transcriptional regulator with XRE-family HTH domain
MQAAKGYGQMDTYSMNDAYKDIFTERLSYLIGRDRMQQIDLARALGVQGGIVSKWLKGDAFPGIRSLVGIAEVFDTSIDWLLDIAESESVAEIPAMTIAQETGLSQSAIEKLQRYREEASLPTVRHGSSKSDVLDSIINDDGFDELLELLLRLTMAASWNTETHLQQLRDAMDLFGITGIDAERLAAEGTGALADDDGALIEDYLSKDAALIINGYIKEKYGDGSLSDGRTPRPRHTRALLQSYRFGDAFRQYYMDKAGQETTNDTTKLYRFSYADEQRLLTYDVRYTFGGIADRLVADAEDKVRTSFVARTKSKRGRPTKTKGDTDR